MTVIATYISSISIRLLTLPVSYVFRIRKISALKKKQPLVIYSQRWVLAVGQKAKWSVCLVRTTFCRQATSTLCPHVEGGGVRGTGGRGAVHQPSETACHLHENTLEHRGTTVSKPK